LLAGIETVPKVPLIALQSRIWNVSPKTGLKPLIVVTSSVPPLMISVPFSVRLTWP
jgi:hypothetical protein